MQIVHKINDFLYTIFPGTKQRTMGIDPNKNDYIISNIDGKRFSGNQVLSYYYISWALSMPEQVHHLGLDFGKEFEMAKKLNS
jgi:hypothetical protein